MIGVLTGSAHLLDGLFKRQPRDLLVVEMRDQVVGHQAGLRGRRIVDRRDDLDDAVLHRHFDAETAEFTARLHLHVAEILRAHVGRMRVERRQHAVDRVFDQLRVVGLFDVVGADALKHVAEQIELAIKFGVLRRRRRKCLRDIQNSCGACQARHQQE